jgi:hypothetical protein
MGGKAQMKTIMFQKAFLLKLETGKLYFGHVTAQKQTVRSTVTFSTRRNERTRAS